MLQIWRLIWASPFVIQSSLFLYITMQSNGFLYITMQSNGHVQISGEVWLKVKVWIFTISMMNLKETVLTDANRNKHSQKLANRNKWDPPWVNTSEQPHPNFCEWPKIQTLKHIELQRRGPWAESSSQIILYLTLKTPRKPASENVVCFCCLLNILANFSNLFLHTGKHCGPWSDCS